MNGSADGRNSIQPGGEEPAAKKTPHDPTQNIAAESTARHIWMIDSIKEASLNTRRLFIIYLTYIFYSAVAIAGTSDKQIVLNEKVRLPLVDVQVPIDQFYFAGAIAAIITFVYFQIYFFRLRELKEELIQYGGEQDINKIYPWIFNFPKDNDSVIEKIKQMVVKITVWMSLPAILVIFVLGFIRKHDPLIFVLFGIALFGTAIVLFLWKRYFRRHAAAHLIGIIAATFGLLLGLIFLSTEGGGLFRKSEPASDFGALPKLIDNITTLDLSGLDLTGEKLIGNEFSYRRFEGAKFLSAKLDGVRFYNANLRGADFEAAFLDKTDFSNAVISDGTLNRCTMIGAGFANSNLQNAKIVDAKLNYVRMTGAKLIGADLSVSKLENAILGGADLSGATLSGAQMNSAVLQQARLNGADLSYADLENADLSYADLEGARFEKARMVKTNLMNTHGVSIEQLSKARTLFGAKLETHIEIELQKNFPALFEEAGSVLRYE